MAANSRGRSRRRLVRRLVGVDGRIQWMSLEINRFEDKFLERRDYSRALLRAGILERTFVAPNPTNGCG